MRYSLSLHQLAKPQYSHGFKGRCQGSLPVGWTSTAWHMGKVNLFFVTSSGAQNKMLQVTVKLTALSFHTKKTTLKRLGGNLIPPLWLVSCTVFLSPFVLPVCALVCLSCIGPLTRLFWPNVAQVCCLSDDPIPLMCPAIVSGTFVPDVELYMPQLYF